MMVGAGSVGGFFGAHLVRKGVDCSFLLRPKTLQVIRTKGLTIQSPEQSFTVHPNASTDPKDLAPADLIVLAVKRYDLDDVLHLLQPVVTPTTTILTLQNGVDTEARIMESFSDVRLLGGLAYIYSKIASPGVIEHYKRGEVAIGVWHGGDVEAVKAVFEAGGIACRVPSDIRRTKWEKMCWNVVFNPLTVLIDDRIAKALTYPDLRVLIHRIVDEAVAVARAEGVDLGPKMAEKLIQSSEEIRDIHTSMFDDWKAGRRTEIEYLNGYLVRQGLVLGVPTPVNATLYALIKAMTELMPLGPAVLRLDGHVLQPITLDAAALAKLPVDAHVPDIGTLMPGARGHGIKVKALLDIATPLIGTDHVTFHSGDGQFAASLLVKDAAATGIVIYERDGQPLSKEAGGPFRLVTPGLGDLCANVKNVARIEFTNGPGKETRPSVVPSS